eukprot:1146658-Pelagomonas_calceolata.AAC.1
MELSMGEGVREPERLLPTPTPPLAGAHTGATAAVPSEGPIASRPSAGSASRPNAGAAAVAAAAEGEQPPAPIAGATVLALHARGGGELGPVPMMLPLAVATVVARGCCCWGCGWWGMGLGEWRAAAVAGCMAGRL